MRIQTVSALLLAGATTAVSAADYELDPITVTASRVAQTADETLAPVTVISRDDIERLQPQSLTDLLRLQPGVDVARTGGLGGNVSVFLRGTNSDHTLVLVDGVRAGSATTGQFNWRSMTPAQIERIEIVRGPRASLYGSDAIGGVIQIFTRRPEGVTAQVEAGSHDTRRGSLGYGGGTDKLRFDITAAQVDSEGFSATNTDSASYHPDDDGFEEQSLSGRIALDFTDSLSGSLSLWHSESENEFDQGVIDDTNQTADARLDWAVTADWSQRLQLGYARDRSETESSFASEIITRRYSVDWQNDVSLGRHLLIAGLSHRRDQADNQNLASGTEVFDDAVRNNAAYGNLLLDFGRHDLELGLRYDDHSEFGEHATGSIAWGFDVNPELRMLASYGTAFKAPTLNELFHPGFSFFGSSYYSGNPDLEPEESETAELGLRYRPSDNQRWRATAFYTEVENLISYQEFVPPSTFNRATNIGLARIKGVELEYAAKLGPWWWQANATVQQARDEKNDQRLLRRADEKLAVVLGRRIGRGEVQADWLLVNHREDRNADLGGYGLLNVSGSHPLGHGLSLTGRIENVTDKEYTLADGYNTPDRAYYIGLRWEPRQ